ncbi:uncharacterized protein BDW43DRAFT_320187 [Aspergillus alliaceus]|uniref:uncharacterized protein n=1 Tax=Petromyces alliaceus TaxID=209559 RepID=UPI0012A3D8E1|nr:uncharacterized protein BDW43DRAFT_320187 [Aspergillus alliaceus]KAB8232212.1 hypothetical protein BDW43DRAFT_320187 [Aspergillus alliaceus]
MCSHYSLPSEPELRRSCPVLVVGHSRGAPSPQSKDTKIFLGDVISGESLLDPNMDWKCLGHAKDVLEKPKLDIPPFLKSLKETRQELRGHAGYLKDVQKSDERWTHRGSTHDVLFEPFYPISYHQRTIPAECLTLTMYRDILGCEVEHIIRRQPNTSTPEASVHFGTFASINSELLSGEHRYRLAEQGIIGFELGSTGVCGRYCHAFLWKGLGNYADGHKHEKGQQYAATSATSAAKSAGCIDLKPKDSHRMVPFDRNPQFVGRQDEIAELEKSVFETEGPRKIAISGLGGVGKTHIALELIYRVRKGDSGYSIFWIPCTSPENIEQSYLSITQVLGMQDVEPAEAKEQVKTYLGHKSDLKWLLIFDNADDMDMWIDGGNGAPALKDFLPRTEQGRIIFTTCNKKLAVKLAPCQILVSEVDEETEGLSEERDTAEPEVVELLREEFEIEGRYKDIPNPRHDPLAAEYLSFMACVNPRNIPQSILPPVKSKIKLIKALVLLSAYSFISDPAKGNPLNLHRLVHLATRNWMRQNQRFADFIGKTAERLNEAFPDNDHSNRKVWRAYLPHALSLSEEKEFKYQHDCYVDLIENMGAPVFCDAKEIQQRRQGKTHPSTLTIMGRFKQAETLETQHHDTLTTMADLAMINYEQGHYKQAETLMVQVLGAMKIVLGPEHRDTLASMAYLGHIYHSQGRLNQAEELYVQVLESQKRVMGPEHPLTVSCIDNLASVYQSQGRLRQAEKLYVQVIEEKEKILGAEHPSTLSSMSNLSSLKKAEELEKQTIEIRKQTLGPEHPSIRQNDLPSRVKTVKSTLSFSHSLCIINP